MCTITAIAHYNEQKSWLDETANLFPDIARWVAWWNKRKYHMFPTLDDLATPTSCWPKVVMQCLSAETTMVIGRCMR